MTWGLLNPSTHLFATLFRPTNVKHIPVPSGCPTKFKGNRLMHKFVQICARARKAVSPEADGLESVAQRSPRQPARASRKPPNGNFGRLWLCAAANGCAKAKAGAQSFWRSDRPEVVSPGGTFFTLYSRSICGWACPLTGDLRQYRAVLLFRPAYEVHIFRAELTAESATSGKKFRLSFTRIWRKVLERWDHLPIRRMQNVLNVAQEN